MAELLGLAIHHTLGRFNDNPNGVYGSGFLPIMPQDVPKSSGFLRRSHKLYKSYDESCDMQPRPEVQRETRPPRAWRAYVYRSLGFILYTGLLAFLQDSLVVMLLDNFLLVSSPILLLRYPTLAQAKITHRRSPLTRCAWRVHGWHYRGYAGYRSLYWAASWPPLGYCPLDNLKPDDVDL